jgi:DNA-binding LacI/PurR family transcriptional regulator
LLGEVEDVGAGVGARDEFDAGESFSLTTVRQPSREMARVGTKMLIDRIHSPGHPARRVNFPRDLISAEAPSAPDRQGRSDANPSSG